MHVLDTVAIAVAMTTMSNGIWKIFDFASTIDD